MNGTSLAAIVLPSLLIGALVALAGAPLCRRFGLTVRAMGGKGERRPAALGMVLLGAVLIPLTYYVCVESSTRLDRLYPPGTQNALIAVLWCSSLLLFAWGWRSDRGRAGLETIAMMWIAQGALWAVGLRIDKVSLRLFDFLPWAAGTGIIEFPAWISLLMTLMWLSIVASVVELLDGIDGLAPLATGVASLAVFLHARVVSPDFLLVQLFALLLASGSLLTAWLGRHSGRLALGKNGSLTLGFWLATLTVLARQKEVAASILTPLFIVGLVLAVILFRFVESSLGFSKVPRPRQGRRPGAKR